jgi:hypothetical protein
MISALTKAISKEINVCSMSKILQTQPIPYDYQLFLAQSVPKRRIVIFIL